MIEGANVPRAYSGTVSQRIKCLTIEIHQTYFFLFTHNCVHYCDADLVVQLKSHHFPRSLCATHKTEWTLLKTKFTHLNPTSEEKLHALDGSEIEKVDDFLYLGGYTNLAHDIETKTCKA